METFTLDTARVRDISELLLDERTRLKVVPARILAASTAEERLMFGVLHGAYCLPTEELCNFLRARIAGRSCIEIGAGNGALASALSIPATDNRQQEEEAVRLHYELLGQPTVPYGDNVEKIDAADAIDKYKPRVVVACWVTHKFDPARSHAGGSATGIDEACVIANCEEYILVGNEHVHRDKAIWALAHEKLTPPWLYSRAINGSADFVAIWRRDRL